MPSRAGLRTSDRTLPGLSPATALAPRRHRDEATAQPLTKEAPVRGVRHALYALMMFLAVACLPLSVAFAETVPERQSIAQVGVTIPNGWMYDATEPDSLVLGAADQSIVMMMTAVDPSELEAALMALDQQIAMMVTDLEPVGEPVETTFNGLRSVMMTGQGTLEDSRIEVGLALIEAPDGRVLLVLSLTDQDSARNQTHSMRSVLESMAPVS